jgi:hypothetical protein
VEEEKELLKNMSGDVDSLQAEINQLRNKLNLVVEELEVTREDNVTLSRELEQQQVREASMGGEAIGRERVQSVDGGQKRKGGQKGEGQPEVEAGPKKRGRPEVG